MRISDWSSDVCSSDLRALDTIERTRRCDIGERDPHVLIVGERALDHRLQPGIAEDVAIAERGQAGLARAEIGVARRRSEERRGGKGCVSTGRSRWSPYH